MSKNIPIIKVKHGIHVNDLVNQLPSLETSFKFTLKVKKNKRWKLRSFRITHHRHAHCECCGPYTVLSFRNKRTRVHLDNHFGPGYASAASIIGS